MFMRLTSLRSRNRKSRHAKRKRVHRVEPLERRDLRASMQSVAGTTRIFEHADGGTVTYVRRGGVTNAAAAGNTQAYNADGTIVLPNRSFDSGQSWLTEIVAHEIGHNWDNENRDWRGFRALSGWTPDDPDSSHYVRGGDRADSWWYLYVNQNEFVSNQARQNPYQDFAETFAAYFMDRLGLPMRFGLGAGAAPDKIEFVHHFIMSLP
jgi:hypothetical protein